MGSGGREKQNRRKPFYYTKRSVFGREINFCNEGDDDGEEGRRRRRKRNIDKMSPKILMMREHTKLVGGGCSKCHY